MAIDKEDKSFKTLINKEFTTPTRKFYDEVGADTVNIATREVWSSVLPEVPAEAITSGSAKLHSSFTLTSDPTFGSKAFFFCSGSGFTPGTDAFDRAFVVRNFISDKFGSGYEIVLRDNGGTIIPINDPINWVFDYKTGILHIGDPGAYSTPYKVDVYQYTGDFLSDTITNISGADGDVQGPASSTDNAFAVYDGTTGKLLKDQSVLLLSGSGVSLTPAGETTTVLGTTAPSSGNIGEDAARFNAGYFDTVVADTFSGSGQDLTLARVAGSTYSTIQDLQDTIHSTGWISGGLITSSLADTVDIAPGTGLIRIADSITAELQFFDWGESLAQSIPSGTIRYIGVEYNGGSPQVTVRSTENWNYNTDFPIGTVANESGSLHIVNIPHATGDHASNMFQRVYETAPLQRDDRTGGIILGETGTRNVTVTAGAIWERYTRNVISAIDTSASDTFDTYTGLIRDAAGATQWDNANYDNGGTKTALTANRYANLWFYIELDGELVMVYGTAEYTSAAAAQDESPPSVLPIRLTDHGKLIGRIIFQEGASSATLIESAFDTEFAASLTSDHGNLSGLADDDHTQYVLADGTRNMDSLTVSGGLATFLDGIQVTGAVNLPNASVSNAELVNSSVTISAGSNLSASAGTLSLGDTLNINLADNVQISGTLVATGSTTLLGGLEVTGAVNLPASSINNTELENSSVTITAGDGLGGGGAVSLGGSVTVSASVGEGLTIQSDNIQLSSSVAGNGLTYTTGVIDVNAGNGIELGGDKVHLATSSAGDGLDYTAGVLSVNAGNGIELAGDAVNLATSSAGAGLTYTAGVLSVDYGSAAGTAVEGDTTLQVSGTTNEIDIDGGTDKLITLGAGGTIQIGLPSSVTIGNLSVTGTLTASNGLDAGGSKLINLGAPTAGTDAATKTYVDSVATGLDLKSSVVAATTASLPTYTSNSVGVGHSLTASVNGIFPNIDGAMAGFPTVDQRLLIKNEALARDNGIYTIAQTGSAGDPWILIRATDADGAPTNEMEGGTYVFVESGSANINSGWIVVGTGSRNVDVDDIDWTQFNGAGQIEAGSGLTKSGNTLNVGAGNGIQVNADDVDVLYGSTVNTAVQGNTTLAVSGTTNEIEVNGGADTLITLGAGGTITLGLPDNPQISGTLHVSGTLFALGGLQVTGAVQLPAQSITNEELVNSGSTVTAGTNLTGGGFVALGGSTTVNLADNIQLSGTLTVTGSSLLSGGLDVGNNVISNVSDPVSDQDAATKNYVDSQQFESLSLIDKDLTSTAQISSPTLDDAYIIAGTGGDWSGGTINDIAVYLGTSGSWEFTTPQEGFTGWVNDEDNLYVFDGTNWIKLETTINNLDMTGDLIVSGNTILGTDGNDTVQLNGRFSVPTFNTSSVPATYVNSPELHASDIFYLSGSGSGSGDFQQGNKFYFNENGFWFASPFISE